MSGEDERPQGWRPAFRLPAGRRTAARDVERELRAHLAFSEAELVAAGMALDAARAEAGRRFGDFERAAAECVEIEGARQARLAWRDRLEALARDLAHAARTLRRAPGFALAAALTLGLGVGATTAMFSVVDAVLLRPLPLDGADQVVALEPTVGGAARGGSPGLLAAWRERSRALSHVAATRERDATLLLAGGPERLRGNAVSGDLFRVLGARAAIGRVLGPADDAPGARAVVVSRRLWSRALGGDARALGQALTLDGVPHVVVGVMPDAFSAVAGEADFWVPLALAPGQRDNFTPYLTLLGRLAPGARPADAARELDAIVRTLGPRAAEDGVTPRVLVRPLGEALGAGYRRPLVLMLAAVAAVLLIACANVATLVLARSIGRARELAVRAALGAGRARLVRQLILEHLLLGVLGLLVALPVAALGALLLARAVPAEVPRLAGAALDGRALLVAATLGLLASVLCGLAPAWGLRRLDVRAALQGGGRGATARAGEGWRRAMVAAQVALAVVLLAGAGLLVRSALALGRVAPGFDLERVATARLALPERDYPRLDATVRAYEAVLAAVRAEPGVTSAALVSRVPLGGAMAGIDVALADRPLAPETRQAAALRIASPDYFRSLGVPLLQGRDLRATDDARGAPVAVVSATLARRLGGGAPVLGRRLRSDNAAFADAAGRPVEYEIVGVAGEVRDGGPRGAPQPELYLPLGQVPEEPWNYWIGRELVLVARAAGDAAALAPALRRAVSRVDPRVPLHDVQTTGQRLAGALAVERFGARLLAVAGLLGLVLAALGIHAVVAYAAAQRTREVGVRLALGASPAQVVRLVVGRSARPVALGLAVGVAAAVLAGQAAAALLFEVTPLDPVSLGGAVLVLGVAGAASCWAPARRVARVEAVEALRAE